MPTGTVNVSILHSEQKKVNDQRSSVVVSFLLLGLHFQEKKMYKILIKRYSSFDDVGLEFFSFELYIVASLSMFCTNTYIINVVEELQTFFSIFIKVPILIVRFHLIFGIISCSFFFVK